jgi:hypothetical protein
MPDVLDNTLHNLLITKDGALNCTAFRRVIAGTKYQPALEPSQTRSSRVSNLWVLFGSIEADRISVRVTRDRSGNSDRGTSPSRPTLRRICAINCNSLPSEILTPNHRNPPSCVPWLFTILFPYLAGIALPKRPEGLRGSLLYTPPYRCRLSRLGPAVQCNQLQFLRPHQTKASTYPKYRHTVLFIIADKLLSLQQHRRLIDEM